MTTETTTTTEKEQSNAVQAMAERRFKVPGDVVNRATAELPDNQRSAIRWLHAYGAENDMSLDELATTIRKDRATLSLVFRGQYEAKLDAVVREIEAFKKIHEERAKGRKLSFIETDLTRRIWSVCRAAVEFQRIVFLFGDTQVGKSEALKAYRAAHNHGETIYVSVPTGGSMSLFMAELAEALRISPQQKDKELRRRILSAFDDRMLLIIDEAHQCLMTKRKSNNPLEFVRELHDRRGCGVVLCGTNVFRDELERGALCDQMRQSKRRRLCVLQLPDRPTQADLNTFAAAHGLPASSGEVRRLEQTMVQEEALGMWLTLLRMGQKLANERRQKMTWSHVESAYAGLKALERAA